MTTPAPVTADNPYLLGNYAPVSGETTADALRVTGRVPTELCGRFVRNGPNPIGTQDPATYHWFTGDGMVHGIRLAGGRADWYRSRWVRSRQVAELLGEEPHNGPVHGGMDFAANTGVIEHAGRTLALVEAGALPMELSYNLDTVGPTTFDGTLDGGFTAHPKRDPATGNLHAISYFPGWGRNVRYSVIGSDGRVHHATDIAVGGLISVHDTAMTERFVVVLDLPVTLNAGALRAGASFPYLWDRDYQARVGLLPLRGDGREVTWFPIDPCYVFHTLNAYDDGDLVVIDLVRHQRVFYEQVNGPRDVQPVLEQWTIDPTRGVVKASVLDDRPQEFPRYDERRTGRRHRYGYAAAFDDESGYSAIIKHDFARNTTALRPIGKGSGPAEPVFVARHHDAAEDDGWLLCLSYDRERDGTDLLILNAADMTAEPQAVVHLPTRVPVGFHGSWLADRSSSLPT